ncbi:MAG TPA: DUF4157 domain-containing protein, partial [Enhygromyxa sp.]|nr:DUF4157 domain-containing protein [Enhygromyxa sp.]
MSTQRATAAKAAPSSATRARVQPATAVKVTHASSSTCVDARAPAIPQAGGQPLPASTRARMSSFFGRNFDRVRVHVGDQAAGAAQRHGAEAFTHGEHICFAPGRYQPGSPAGDRLLVHELTHVAQQGGSGGLAVGSAHESVSRPNEPGELEAELNTQRFAAGLPARVTAGLSTRERIMRRATGAFALDLVAPTLEITKLDTSAAEPEREDQPDVELEAEGEAKVEPVADELAETVDGEPIDEEEAIEPLADSRAVEPVEESELDAEDESSEAESRESTPEPARVARTPELLEPAPAPVQPRSRPRGRALRIVPAAEPEPALTEAGTATRTTETEAETTEREAEPIEEPREGGACVINPRAEYEGFLGRVQAAWEAGSGELEDTEARPCSSLAVAEGREPHESGTLGHAEIEPTRSLPATPDTPARARTEDDALTRARGDVIRTIAPERPAPAHDETPEDERARSSRRAELAGPLAQSLADGPASVEPAPRVSEESEESRAHTRDSLADFQRAQQQKRTQAKQRAQRDFGEGNLAPHRDPTLGHDDLESSLRPPEFDAATVVEEQQLDRIPTDRNVGMIALAEVAPVAERDLDPREAELRRQRDTQAEVDAEIEQSQADLDRQCREQSDSREELSTRVSEGVDAQRESLRRELDEHGDAREREADRISTDGAERATRIRDEAERQAEQTVEQAETEADARWRVADDEAHRRADRATTGS